MGSKLRVLVLAGLLAAPAQQSSAIVRAAAPLAAPGHTKALSIAPARLWETRTGPGLATIDGQYLGGGRLNGLTTREIKIAGRGGVPANATAAMINVAVVDPAAAGYA